MWGKLYGSQESDYLALKHVFASRGLFVEFNVTSARNEF